MINVRFTVILFSVFFSVCAPAFQVNTLTKIISEDNDSLILTGDAGREYLYTSVSRVRTDRAGNIHEDLLEPDDIENWPVIVEPGEVILDQGDEIRVRINRNGPQNQDDIVLGLSFIPESTTDNSTKGSGLQIAVGYKTWLFIPGKAPLKGHMTAFREGGKLVIDNMTNKILRIIPGGCAKNSKEECTGALISLPQTQKRIDNTDSVRSLDIYLIGDSQKKIEVIKL